MCKFSIIVPCYNIEHRVKDLFEMLCCLEYTDYEVIYVDDSSKDKTFENLCEYAKQYSNYHVYQTPQNGGPGVARNVGLDNASGEYILFCDCDDGFDISALSKMDDFLKSHEDADIVVFPHNIIRKYGSQINDTYSKYQDGDSLSLASVALGSPSPCAKIYKMSIISANNVRYPALKSGEDACFLMGYVPYIKKAYKSNIAYYTYIMRKGSLTHQKSKFIEKETFFERFLPVCREYFPENEIRMFVNGHLLSMAKQMTDAGCTLKQIREWFEKANSLYPDWINKIDYKHQSTYRKLIYSAMYRSNALMIKLVMQVRRWLY